MLNSINRKIKAFDLFLPSKEILDINTNEPYFYDKIINIEKVPLCIALKENFSIIKKELLSVLDTDIDAPLDPVFYVGLDNYVVSKKDKDLIDILHGFSLFNMINENRKIIDVEKLTPFTYNFFDKFRKEDAVLASFVSKLKPQTVINKHKDKLYGGTCLRLHLCLEEDLGSTLTVGNETRTWREGEFLLFDAGNYLHSVDHSGTKNRTILIIDVKKKYLEEYRYES